MFRSHNDKQALNKISGLDILLACYIVLYYHAVFNKILLEEALRHM